MSTQFVRIVFDLYCQWTGIYPVYRVYVNDELMTERTWRQGPLEFIRENMSLQVSPGKYTVRIENLSPETSEFKQRNLCSTAPTVNIINSYTFEVV